MTLLDRLIDIVERFPRDYEEPHRRLVACFNDFRSDPANGQERFTSVWADLTGDILTTPQWVSFLFPEQCREHPELSVLIRKAHNAPYCPPEIAQATANAVGEWVSDNANPDNPAGLINILLEDLTARNPADGPPFQFVSRYYCFKDLLYGYFLDAGWKHAHRAIFRQLYLQRLGWQRSYIFDYPYQGLSRLGIGGAKPSEERLARYAIDDCLRGGDRILDIGSNCGFFSIAIAERVGRVEGIEFNPYLVSVANQARDFLGVENASFSLGDFEEFEPAGCYDAVFSLANHCTIDGNLNMGFEDYIAKVYALLHSGGYLFFESHNVFGPGKGTPGDDGDLDRKFEIVERYFEVVRHRMLPAFVPAHDIDKLFVVLRRRPSYQENAKRTFSLAEAKKRYAY